MVKFTEISIKDGYVYAIEEDVVTGDKARVKLRLERGNEEYYYTGTMTSCMVRALWNLRSVYEEQGMLNTEETIYWG